MPSAEVLTIGTELLLGEIVDTNSRYIARNLRDHGVDIYFLATVGDNTERIASALQQMMERSEIIITTGGLGPTVDDPTREAVSLAMGVEMEYRPELWELVQNRIARFGKKATENNKRQAYIPKGAKVIENAVGSAPCFIVETEKNAIISLPGVPREMEHIMQHEVIPYLKERFDLRSTIKTRILRTAGMGESWIDNLIGDLEMLSNPTVGLAAHAGTVDIRITAKAETLEEIDKLIAPVEADLRKRLEENIYGADEETLEEVAIGHIQQAGWNLAVVEAGLAGGLTQRLAHTDCECFLGGEVLTFSPDEAALEKSCRAFKQNRGADVCFGVSLIKGEEMQTLHLCVLSPVKDTTVTRTYGGPPLMAARWSVNVCLDFIRRLEIVGQ